MASKTKTNEQVIRTFLKDLHTIEVALLRERLLKISEITRAAIDGPDRKHFNNLFVTANDWLLLCDKIDKHLKFED